MAADTAVQGAAEAAALKHGQGKLPHARVVVELPALGHDAAPDLGLALLAHEAGVDPWRRGEAPRGEYRDEWSIGHAGSRGAGGCWSTCHPPPRAVHPAPESPVRVPVLPLELRPGQDREGMAARRAPTQVSEHWEGEAPGRQARPLPPRGERTT